MAEALYRKYRPQIFEDVVGQEHIERTIKNAIEQDKVSHAYLFTVRAAPARPPRLVCWRKPCCANAALPPSPTARAMTA